MPDPAEEDKRRADALFEQAREKYSKGEYMDAIETFHKVTDKIKYEEEAWFYMGEAAMKITEAEYPIINAVNYYNNACNRNPLNHRNFFRKAAAFRRLAMEEKAKNWDYQSSIASAIECYEKAMALDSVNVEIAYEAATYIHALIFDEKCKNFDYDNFIRLNGYFNKIEKLTPRFRNIGAMRDELSAGFVENLYEGLGIIVERTFVSSDRAPAYILAIVSFHNYGTNKIILPETNFSLTVAGETTQELKLTSGANCKSEFEIENQFMTSFFSIDEIYDRAPLLPNKSRRASLFFVIPEINGAILKDSGFFLNIRQPAHGEKNMKIKLKLDRTL